MPDGSSSGSAGNPLSSLRIVSEHRGFVYGFSILWIVLFHYRSFSASDFFFGFSYLEWVNNFAKTGNVGVDIFLLMSGICLYFSFQSDSNCYSFIKKRLARVVVPSLIIFSIWWLYDCIFTESTLWSFFSRASLMGFWMTGYRSMWFVSFIIVMYFLYPYLYGFLFVEEGRRCVARTIVLVIAVLVLNYSFLKVNPSLFGDLEVALCRIPIFVVGCCMGKFVYEGKELGAWWPAAMLVATVAFLASTNTAWFKNLPTFYERLVYLAAAVPLCYSIAFFASFLSGLKSDFPKALVAFFSFCGGISMEIYLMHIVLSYWFELTPLWHEGCWLEYVFLGAVAVLLSWALSRAQAPLIKKLSGRR